MPMALCPIHEAVHGQAFIETVNMSLSAQCFNAYNKSCMSMVVRILIVKQGAHVFSEMKIRPL